MALKLSHRTTNGVLVIKCAGHMVYGDEITQLRELVKSGLSQNIVLNLADVSYIDSGGLGTLVSLVTSARNAGGDIKLANLTKPVADLLKITKLITCFESYDDEHEAVKAFGSFRCGASTAARHTMKARAAYK